MIQEFHDKPGRSAHEKFQYWRRKHPNGFFLTFVAKNHARLHSCYCWHLGDNAFTRKQTGVSLTIKRKVCATNPSKLERWADQNNVELSYCTHCIEFTEPKPTSLNHSATSTQVKQQKQSVTKSAKTPLSGSELLILKSSKFVLEGIAKEITKLSKSRSKRLREMALVRSAGICEACGINYSKVLRGDGRRVLQVHHRLQLALLDVPTLTSADDLAVVCANCHALIHADPKKAVPVDTLRQRWLDDAK